MIICHRIQCFSSILEFIVKVSDYFIYAKVRKSNVNFLKGNLGSPFFINRTINGVLRTFAVGLMSNSTKCGLA